MTSHYDPTKDEAMRQRIRLRMVHGFVLEVVKTYRKPPTRKEYLLTTTSERALYYATR